MTDTPAGPAMTAGPQTPAVGETPRTLTAGQVGPFLRSVIASGERLSRQDVADIEAAITSGQREAAETALRADLLSVCDVMDAWTGGHYSVREVEKLVHVLRARASGSRPNE